MAILPASNETKKLKKTVLSKIVKSFKENNLEEGVRKIPYEMIPDDASSEYRCCIYKEREIIKDRSIASLGIAVEGTKDDTAISEYVNKAMNRTELEPDVMTVLDIACHGCVPCRYYVTDLCQGCVARPCTHTCKFGAISVFNGHSHINQEKCKNCGMCAQACPYQAIAKIIVPCENACPVGAIHKGENGHAVIDYDRCIACGKCLNSCPFGAIHEKSQIIDILKAMRAGKKVIAMPAPSIMGQFACTPAQLHTAIKKAGFSLVYEVAIGADITTEKEAEEFQERMKAGDAFMTTSCCAGWNQLIAKHIPEIKPYESDTKTPAYYTAEIVKKEHPDSVTVFISPCVAKRKEAMDNENIDYVLNYEELDAIFDALEIKPSECEDDATVIKASKQGMNFGVTEGVAKAVASIVPENSEIKPHVINGINAQSIKELRSYVKNNKCENGNLIEVMCCEGGCVGGNACVNECKKATRQCTKYSEESFDLKTKQ